MKNVPLIDELRAVRQQLAQEQECNVEKYAAMLREVARVLPGEYLTQPVLPPVETQQAAESRHAG
jgi:hypothetical protein